MASSVGVNPVIIRKTLSQLKKADLIFVQIGEVDGSTLAMAPEEINLGAVRILSCFPINLTN